MKLWSAQFEGGGRVEELCKELGLLDDMSLYDVFFQCWSCLFGRLLATVISAMGDWSWFGSMMVHEVGCMTGCSSHCRCGLVAGCQEEQEGQAGWRFRRF